MPSSMASNRDDPVTMAARSPRHRITVALPPAAGVVALATIAVGLYLDGSPASRSDCRTRRWCGNWAPQADPLLVVSIACFAAAVAVAPRLLSSPRRCSPPRRSS